MFNQFLFNTRFIFLTLTLLLALPSILFASTDIANGKLFYCEGSEIKSTKTGALVVLSKARNKFRSIISQQNLIINNSNSTSKMLTKARNARRNAKLGLSDVKLCIQQELDGTIRGSWNLITENGLTPSQSGYNLMTINFLSATFVQVFDGDSVVCNWQGVYTANAEQTNLSITVISANGGDFCASAVNQVRSAIIELSPDKNTLTIDYRPSGTLQVYERTS